MPAPAGDGHPDHDGWSVVTVPGDLDYYSADGFARDLYEVVSGSAQNIVLDMAAVTFLDSTGLRVLLGAARDLRADGGDLRLAAPHDSVLRVIELTQVGPLLPTYPDVGTACDG